VTDGAVSSELDDIRPRPAPNETNRFYWEAASQHRLVLQKCRDCGKFQYPPDVACVFCQSQSSEHAQVSGRGTLYSFAVVDRLFHIGWTSKLPYVVGLIDLVEQPGLRMLTNIVDVDPADVAVGMNVEVTFEDRSQVTLPQFRPSPIPSTAVSA
jgi:uncharacterized protein